LRVDDNPLSQGLGREKCQQFRFQRSMTSFRMSA
jgi:hypothetical protein